MSYVSFAKCTCRLCTKVVEPGIRTKADELVGSVYVATGWICLSCLRTATATVARTFRSKAADFLIGRRGPVAVTQEPPKESS